MDKISIYTLNQLYDDLLKEKAEIEKQINAFEVVMNMFRYTDMPLGEICLDLMEKHPNKKWSKKEIYEAAKEKGYSFREKTKNQLDGISEALWRLRYDKKIDYIKEGCRHYYFKIIPD